MSNPFVGEIRLFGGNFAPVNWQFCDGRLLSISEFSTLYNLIGTTYGGDGVQTFGLPDLRSRVPIHWGTGLGLSTYVIGQQSGVETVTLTQQQLPQHTHSWPVSTASAGGKLPIGQQLGVASVNAYQSALPAAALYESSGGGAQALTNVGGSQPHDNLMPYLAVTYIISLFGVYPSQN